MVAWVGAPLLAKDTLSYRWGGSWFEAVVGTEQTIDAVAEAPGWWRGAAARCQLLDLPAGRIEVEIVARHHQDLARLDGQKRGGAQAPGAVPDRRRPPRLDLALKLPTFLREYDKLAQQCAASMRKPASMADGRRGSANRATRGSSPATGWCGLHGQLLVRIGPPDGGADPCALARRYGLPIAAAPSGTPR